MLDERRDGWLTPGRAPAERPTHVIAHLSDTHLTAPGVAYNGVLDADAALDRTVAVLRTAIGEGRRLDAVVVSGDLTDSGDPSAYRRLAASLATLTEPESAATDASPVAVYATGNHDVRAEFHRQLLGRNDTDDPVLQVIEVGGLRLLVLDSTIPGAGHGRLEPTHLAELRRVLATPATAGSILVLHHAPVPPPSPLLSYFALDPASRMGLRDAIVGTDVRIVLAGHHHLAQSAMLGGVPVAVAGSTAIRTDPLAPAGHERTWASGGFNLVEVYPDTVVVSVVPVDGAANVFDLDEAGYAAVINAHPIDQVGGARARHLSGRDDTRRQVQSE